MGHAINKISQVGRGGVGEGPGNDIEVGEGGSTWVKMP